MMAIGKEVWLVGENMSGYTRFQDPSTAKFLKVFFFFIIIIIKK